MRRKRMVRLPMRQSDFDMGIRKTGAPESNDGTRERPVRLRPAAFSFTRLPENGITGGADRQG